LIAYAQNDLEVSLKSVEKNIPVALPRFTLDPEYDLSTDMQLKYASYYGSID
jgi:cytochrome oxidase Cu insertion factor (SCO1/SenC/PrrC family)